MCSDTAWSIPCCAAASASISVEGPLSAVGTPLCELGDDGGPGGTIGSAAVESRSKPILDQHHLHCTRIDRLAITY